MNRPMRSVATGIGLALGVAMASAMADGPRTIPVSQFEAQLQKPVLEGERDRAAAQGSDQEAGIKQLMQERPDESMTFMVAFEDMPISLYTGGIDGLEATSPAVTGGHRLKSDSSAVQAYESHLKRQHESFLNNVRAELGRDLNVIYRYTRAYNGMAVELTPREALAVNRLDGVRYVVADQELELDTDTGPGRIGAPDVWDASDPMLANRGEGVIVGVIDSGIIPGHVAFAEEVEASPDHGIDAYTHTNPLGSGVYLGVCDQEHADYDPDFPCNDKLIGAYSFLDGQTSPPASSPRDQNGHGSHTAGTAAGNPVAANIFPWYSTEELLTAAGSEDPFEVPVSGVAPRANVIAYHICAPSCFSSDTVASVEQAIEDGVDVLNYSISGASDPYGAPDPVSEVWLGATHAGIYVAASAGNDGPGAGTVSKLAPWVTSVAANTHGRSFRGVADLTVDGGDSDIGPFEGGGLTGEYTGSVVVGEDFGTEDDVARQCADIVDSFFGPALVNPFDPGEFDGEIVVCELAVDDVIGIVLLPYAVQNVAAAGGGGVIYHNREDLFFVDANGDETFSAGFRGDIPAVSVVADTGSQILEWLETGTDHTATIGTAEVDVLHNEAAAGQVSNFSSRGPASFAPEYADLLKPDISAPGQNIFAPYWADIGDANNENYHAISGTSMSSPHTAGAAALMRAAHPDWTPMQIKSALMLTAEAMSGFDWYDQGAGEVRVGNAINAGLVMDESIGNMIGANPFEFGNLRTLNLASMANASCLASCSWTRTFEATRSGTFSFSGVALTDNVEVSVFPEELTLQAGQKASVTVTMEGSGLVGDQPTAFGRVMISDSTGGPDMAMPIAAEPDDSVVLQDAAFDAGLSGAYGIAHTLMGGNVWIGDRAGAGGSDELVGYNFDGSPAGVSISTTDYADGAADEWGAGLAYVPATGNLWHLNVGGDACLHEVDPEAGEATGESICLDPADLEDDSLRAVVYDSVNELLYFGDEAGWIYQVDMDGNVLDSVDTDYMISGLAINPVGGLLFVADNGGDSSADVFIRDLNNAYAFVDDIAFADASGDRVLLGSVGDLTIDCDGNVWVVNQDTGMVHGINMSGARGICPSTRINLSGVEVQRDASSPNVVGVVAPEGELSDGVDLELTYTTTGGDWRDEFRMRVISPLGTEVLIGGGAGSFGAPGGEVLDYDLGWPSSSGTSEAEVLLTEFAGEQAEGAWTIELYSSWGANTVAGVIDPGMFDLLGLEAPLPEIVSTSVSGAGSRQVQFHGSVNTFGQGGQAYFEWGTNGEFDDMSSPVSLGSSFYPQGFSHAVDFRYAGVVAYPCGSSVDYRVVAESATGEEVVGATQQLEMPACPDSGDDDADREENKSMFKCSLSTGEGRIDPLMPLLGLLALLGIFARRRV